jgi:hypothetical protein
VEDKATRAHADLLYNVLANELEETIESYHDLLSHGVITYKYLWALFKPGDLVLCRYKGEKMLMKLQSSDYESGGFSLYCKFVDWNGLYFGYASQNISIGPFNGTRPITDLDAYPLQFDSASGVIEERLAKRGKKFEKLQGYHYKAYTGFAELVPQQFGDRTIPTRNRSVSYHQCS